MPEDRPYPYTPASIREIIEEALSGTNSPYQNDNEPVSLADAMPGDATTLSRSSSSSSSLVPLLPPEDVPIAPTPLQTISNPDSPTSSSFPSPIRPLSPLHGAVSTSSPTDTPNDQPMAYEVDASFLRAIVGVLENQDNAVPEKLSTGADAQSSVQKELRKQNKNTVPPSEDITLLSPYITWTVTMMLMVSGGLFVVFQRACLVAPEHVWWLLGGVWKGIACGMASSMLAKWILGRVDKWGAGESVRLRP